MEDNGVRKTQVPNLALPPPPRFDAAATAAARAVEPLSKSRLSSSLELQPTIRDHLKLLIGIAIVSLATGAAGGMFIKDRQQRLNMASVVPLIESANLESATPLNSQEVPSSLEPSPEPVQPQPTPRRPRRVPRREVVILADKDEDEEDEDEEKDKDKENDNDNDKDDDDRRKERDREKNRKDRDRNPEYDRNHRSRQRAALLYDVVRTRRP